MKLRLIKKRTQSLQVAPRAIIFGCDPEEPNKTPYKGTYIPNTPFHELLINGQFDDLVST